MKPFIKFGSLTRVEESESGLATAYCLATSEAIDSENERCVYADTKPEYKIWSDTMFKATTSAGQQPSLGNIRLMHGSEIAAKAIKVDFLDDTKQIFLGTQAVDKRISDMLRGGYISGMSQAGSYLFRRCAVDGTDIKGKSNFCDKCQAEVVVNYAAKISEVSYVDQPANPEARFQYVKSDQSMELRKFAAEPADLDLAKNIPVLPPITETPAKAAARGEDPNLTDAQKAAMAALKAAKTKRVAGEDLHSSAFAWVGDADKPDTWKLPIKFSTDAKTVRHIRNALARLSSTRGIPADKKAEVKARIISAAKSHGVEFTDSDKIAKAIEEAVNKASQASLQKDMYDVSRFADLIDAMAYLWSSAEYEADYEGDGSTIPAELRDLIDAAANTLCAMCEEETRELTARATKSTAAPAANEEKMNEEMLKVLKAARSGMNGFCKGMAKVEKTRAAAHAELAPSETTMAESHKARAAYYNDLHKSFTEAAAVEGITPELKFEHEAQATAYKAYADHHTSAEAHHVLKAKHHASMATVHTSAGSAYTTMAAFQEEGEAAKAAETELVKMAAPEVAAVPNIAEIIAQTMAAANEVNKTAMAEMQKSFTAQRESLDAKLATLTDQTEKRNAAPGKLRLVPLPGAAVNKAAGAVEPLESGAVGF